MEIICIWIKLRGVCLMPDWGCHHYNDSHTQAQLLYFYWRPKWEPRSEAVLSRREMRYTGWGFVKLSTTMCGHYYIMLFLEAVSYPTCLPVQSGVDCWGDLQPRLQHHLLSLQPDVLGPFNKPEEMNPMLRQFNLFVQLLHLPNPAIMLSSQRGGWPSSLRASSRHRRLESC